MGRDTGSDEGTRIVTSIEASKARQRRIAIVDIFGKGRLKARASEEYLSKSADISLF
jgi:hypothetical protein